MAIYCHQFFNIDIDIDIAARWKLNIDIDIGNINILLQYIAQQYIDLYPWLKGIKDPGVIYQYTETMPPLTSYIRRNVRPEYPILGRIDEIDRIMAETCSGEDRCFVVIEGDKGTDKLPDFECAVH